MLLEESGPPSPRVVEIYIELCKFVELKDSTVSGQWPGIPCIRQSLA